MLGLAVATDACWAERAVANLDTVLLEQAHLERKAAAAAINYLFRYQGHAAIQAPLSELAREELTHFERCLSWLARRGIAFAPQQASPYAERLLAAVRPREPERLLDSFLCSALIEARSCERMRLLAVALAPVEPELAAAYRDLVASEARHHGLYLRLAKEICTPAQAEARLGELAVHEAAVLARMPASARLHTA